MATNNFTLHIATENGSGSQSANNILVKSLFRLGLKVSGKNLFPSNIQGLPTWFTIRVNPDGFLSNSLNYNIILSLNPVTFAKDIAKTKPGSVFIYNDSFKFDKTLLNSEALNIAVPFTELAREASDSAKLRKLLINIIYVGVLSELIGLDFKTVEAVIGDQFKSKPSVAPPNIKAFRIGVQYAKEHLSSIKSNFDFKVKAITGGNDGKILIDGNTATSLGLVYGGCNFMSWYPITPSSSIAEGFDFYAKQLRVNKDAQNNFAVVQAEDEISALSMVLGSGWAGGRAVTCTSGPGLSLMSEAAGYSYFAEIPAVIWDVQRGGPSTGLPTRTQQSDVLFAAHLSHGDTEHVLLLPANPKECFEFAQTCFDLAERLQTLIIVLSDLDLGMNFWCTDELKPLEQKFDRGKVLNSQALNERGEFNRYKDLDGDSIPYRTLPGTEHKQAAYFTRGTGHDESAQYSESPEVYEHTLDRLKLKYETAKKYVPKPLVQQNDKIKTGLIAYGSTDSCIQEAQSLLQAQNISTNYLRVRALPFTDEVLDYLQKNDRIYLIEQNRDAQLKQLLLNKYPQFYDKVHSVLNYNGQSISAEFVTKKILSIEGGLS